MHSAAATFTKMKFCPLIDASALEFSALRCHQMKISQPGERINTELCHAISVGPLYMGLIYPCRGVGVTAFTSGKG